MYSSTSVVKVLGWYSVLFCCSIRMICWCQWLPREHGTDETVHIISSVGRDLLSDGKRERDGELRDAG